MNKEITEKKVKTRTEITDLKREEQELSIEQQKKIQGGANRLVGGGIRGSGTTSVTVDSAE